MEPFLYLLLGITCLGCGAYLLVAGGGSLANRFGVPPVIVGLTLVAWGTSAPEFIVSFMAATKGSTDLMFGNVIGSNLANIGLILPIASLLMRPKVDKVLWEFDIPVLVFATLLFSLFCLRGESVSWLEGLFMMLFFGAYTIVVINKAFKQSEDNECDDCTGSTIKDLLFIILGSIGLFYGGEWLVSSSTYLAKNVFHISEAVIGATIVAVGTSLPELATTAVAASRRESGIAIGNVVGSNLFNMFAVVGPISLLSNYKMFNVPAIVYPSSSTTLLWFMVAITLTLPVVIFKRDKLQRSMSTLLLLVYIIAMFVAVKGQ